LLAYKRAGSLGIVCCRAFSIVDRLTLPGDKMAEDERGVKRRCIDETLTVN
jgi:hypothetical protein